jgi:hypothetical protein
MPTTAPPSRPPGRWRAYVTGLDAGQPGDLDRSDLDWDTARDLLLDRILPFLASACACCREAAMECPVRTRLARSRSVVASTPSWKAPPRVFPDVYNEDRNHPADMTRTAPAQQEAVPSGVNMGRRDAWAS